MRTCIIPLAALVLVTQPTFAAKIAKHTTTTTNANGVATMITETVADENKNIRIDNHPVTANAGTSSSATATSNNNNNSVIRTQRGAANDTMVFLADQKKIIFSDGGRCQQMSPDSPPPAGMPPGGMQDIQEQMSAAQAEMDKAFAEMAKQNPQMAEQLRKSLGGGAPGGPMAQSRTQYELVETGRKRDVDQYKTVEFEMRNAASGEKQQTVYAAPIHTVPDARLIADGMLGMYEVMQEYMNNMGVGALANTSSMSAIMEKMRDYYPILIIDHEDNSKIRLTSISGGGVGDFNLSCNAQ